MPVFDDMIDALEGAGAPPEVTAQAFKLETLLEGLGSLDFDALATEDYGILKESFEDAGAPEEAIAALEKVKSLLINGD